MPRMMETKKYSWQEKGEAWSPFVRFSASPTETKAYDDYRQEQHENKLKASEGYRRRYWGEVYDNRLEVYKYTETWLEEWGPTKQDYIEYAGKEHYAKYAPYVYSNDNFGKQMYHLIEGQKQQEKFAQQALKDLEATAAQAEIDAEEARLAMEQEIGIAQRDSIYNRIMSAQDMSLDFVDEFMEDQYFEPLSRGVVRDMPDRNVLLQNRMADLITEEELSSYKTLSEKFGKISDQEFILGEKGYFNALYGG
jgi:hypothetical protein